MSTNAPVPRSDRTLTAPEAAEPGSVGPSLSPDAAPVAKRWSVGTLTYTTGSLTALFLLLLLGDFSWSMRDRSVGPMAQWYLKDLGVPNFLFALLISTFPAAVGLLLGPIISYKSDRHRGPRGRRIPFLLITTPIAAFGMLGLAATPFISRWVHSHFPEQSEMLVAVLCFGVFWAAFEFATITASAVFGGLIGDVVPAPLLGRFYGLFRAVSLIDGIIFNFWIFGKIETHYTIILLLIGTFYGASFYWVCLKVKEGGYPPPPPEPENSPGPLTGLIVGAKTYFRECFSHSYYIWVFIMFMIAGICFMPVNTFMIPYATSLGMSMDAYGKCLALTFTISLILAYPLGWLSDLFHPLRMAIGCLAGYAVVAAWGAVYARDASTFSIALVLHGVLSGCYFTCSASLGLRLFPKSQFAQFASAAGLMGSVFGMVIGPLIGKLIDVTGNLYHHTFTSGCVLSIIALSSAIYVHGKFIRLGGVKNYIAPV